MPQSGAVALSDLAAPDGKPHLTIVCHPCGREGRYSVRKLLETLGDMGLPDLLAQLTQDCQRHRSAAIHERCKAVFQKLPVR